MNTTEDRKGSPRTVAPLRRTLLYVPGNNPAMINNSGVFGADVIVFDLEDSVSVNEKDAARALVSGALSRPKLVNPLEAEVMVRINGLDSPFAEDDIAAVVRRGLHSVRLPKTESAQTVLELVKMLEEAEDRAGLDYRIEISPILETVAAVAAAREIASAHPRVTALSFGAEDFTRDLGTSRSKDGSELAHARGTIVLAAKAAGIQAIDTVYPDVMDDDGLDRETRAIRQLGFDGKSVIHPRQIDIIHRVFRPSDEEIRHARRIEKAIADAESKGSGVISVDGRMVDAPVVKKARQVLALARRLGLTGEGEDRCR